jgi:hypothetical protein
MDNTASQSINKVE